MKANIFQSYFKPYMITKTKFYYLDIFHLEIFSYVDLHQGIFFAVIHHKMHKMGVDVHIHAHRDVI